MYICTNNIYSRNFSLLQLCIVYVPTTCCVAVVQKFIIILNPPARNKTIHNEYARVGSNESISSSCVKLLGVYFDQKLNFDKKNYSIGMFDKDTGDVCKQNATFSFMHIVTVRVLPTCMALSQQREEEKGRKDPETVRTICIQGF